MRIKNLRLYGWRSFSNEGVNFKNFKHINVIIGPNNAGKSNLFKYLFYLRSIIREICSRSNQQSMIYIIKYPKHSQFKILGARKLTLSNVISN